MNFRAESGKPRIELPLQDRAYGMEFYAFLLG
jgi:hypothetical protein